MAKSKVLLLTDEIERKWPLNGRYGPARGWDRRWWKLKELLAAQQLAEADRAGQLRVRQNIDAALRELGSIRVFGDASESQRFIQNAIIILAETYRSLGPAA